MSRMPLKDLGIVFPREGVNIIVIPAFWVPYVYGFFETVFSRKRTGGQVAVAWEGPG